MDSSHNHGRAAACNCCAPAPKGSSASANVWSVMLPLVACAVCPACLATYTKLLSLVGVGLELDEALHHLLLAVALAVSLGVSGWRSWRTKRAWPLLLAAAGGMLVASGHLLGELQVIEWAGVLVLLAGGVSELTSSSERASRSFAKPHREGRGPARRSALHPEPAPAGGPPEPPPPAP